MGGKSSNKSSQSDTVNTDNRAIQQEENNGVQVLGANNTITSTTTDYGALDAANEIAAGAVNMAGDLGKDAFTTAKDLAEISAGTTEKSFDFAETVAVDSLNGMQTLSADVVKRLAEANFENGQLIAGISSSQMKSNEEQLNAITELAKSAQSGGLAEMASQQSKVVSYVVVGAVLVAAVIAFGG